MDLTLDVASAYITPAYNNKEIKVEIQGVSQADILENFSVKEVVSHFGAKDLLDWIGENEAKIHFDLIEKE